MTILIRYTASLNIFFMGIQGKEKPNKITVHGDVMLKKLHRQETLKNDLKLAWLQVMPKGKKILVPNKDYIGGTNKNLLMRKQIIIFC